MVDGNVGATNGEMGRREVRVPKGVVGLVLDVEWPEYRLLLDVMGHFCLYWGGVVGDSCCTENLLEDGLKGLRVDDVVVDEFLTDAGAAKK